MHNQGSINIKSGVMYMIISVLFFVLMDSTIKLLSGNYHVSQVIFFRSLFGLIILVTIIQNSKGKYNYKISSPGQVLLCSITGVVAIACLIYAVQNIPLANFYTIQFSAPLFMTAFAVPILGEKVGLQRWMAVIVGFIGVLIAVNPTSGMIIQFESLIALTGSMFFALYLIQLRRLTRTHNKMTLVFYFVVTCIAVTSVMLPFFWKTPSLQDLFFLAALGLFCTFGQITTTKAYSLAPMAIISPFEYTHIFWGTAIGYLFWNEVPAVNVYFGCAIVVLSGLFILYRETRVVPRKLSAELSL
jgi:drug/metabolite transporter (DMT)-like permease